MTPPRRVPARPPVPAVVDARMGCISKVAPVRRSDAYDDTFACGFVGSGACAVLYTGGYGAGGGTEEVDAWATGGWLFCA